MSTNIKNGFTMIELMLFFAVAGVLVAALLVGSGVAVADQRYRDSVKSLQSILQDQYGQVANVVNDRDDNLSCSSSGAISAGGAGTPRGTSESCMLIGRFIQSHRTGSGVAAGSALHIHPVIAAGGAASGTAPLNDTDAINQFNLTLDTTRYEQQQLEWGSKMRLSGLSGANAQQFSILIVRSPLSGNIRTYVTSGSYVSNPSAMVGDANLNRDLTICVDTADGELVSGEKMAVRLLRNASNQSGVETVSQDRGSGC